MTRPVSLFIIFLIISTLLIVGGVALMLMGVHYNIFLPVFSVALASVGATGFFLGRTLGVVH